MTFLLQRHITGQTPLGVFHNIGVACETTKYINVHVGTWRWQAYWLTGR